ncbi:hypothetical protein BGZ50_008907 [Haplosporangium sp. Z 11]|nr:hypothetical protein BGZ50_008907 [Haplosporangium sp. Z 11]
MIALIRTGLLAVLLIVFLSTTLTGPVVEAHSSPWPTITRSEHILNLRHDILPRRTPYDLHRGQPLAKRNADQILSARPDIISRDDTLRFQFSAFNTTFYLYLEPNTDLIHPEADLGPDISLDDIKAFKGVVIQDAHHSDRKWERAATTSRMAKRTVEHMMHEEGIVGWARMMVEHDENDKDTVLLRGAFMVNGDTYHVTSRQHYHIQKRSDDAIPPPTSSGPNLVIYRDSDLYKPSSFARRKRGLATDEATCGADLILNKTSVHNKDIASYEHYYPPDRTATVPMSGEFDASSSWTDVLKSPLAAKQNLVIRAAGPDPVPAGCPANRLVNYMGVAADCAYVRTYGGQAAARKQIFADFNTASGIYESTFNVALGVIALNIMSENCPAAPIKGEEWNQDCSTGYSIDQRLSDFSFWRGQDGRQNDGAGLWHLMTKCNSGSVVGIAWTTALCQMKTQPQNAQGGIQYTAGTGVSSITPNEWMVVAHEIGHGFGAIHDCTSQTCPPTSGQCCPLSSTSCDAGAQFIMNPSEQTATRVFSPCSISTICKTIQSSAGQCLKPPGTRETQSGETNICGNGLKETGEDCDCGSAEECANDPCCDGTTCKFKAGAVCDDLNDDCCLNCQMRSAGYVCRRAISECDIQEVCTGTSATCPPDVKLENLTPCGNNSSATGLQCANGLCTSRDAQCQQQDRPGINKQCGASNSCDLMCNDPDGNALTCIQIPGAHFIDGSPCGFGGTCLRGECKYSNGIKGFLNWARNHLSIVIPVGCLIGLILICIIWTCCCSGFFQNRRQRKMIRKPSRTRSNGARTVSGRVRPAGPSGPAGPPPSRGSLQGAQHGGQQQQRYPMEPMAPMAPPPVYYDPSVLARSREDEELQRAIEESRREHESQLQATASTNTYHTPLVPPVPSEMPNHDSGAIAASTSPVSPSPHHSLRQTDDRRIQQQ